MPTSYPRPLENTYWVEPGLILAGEYPGDLLLDEGDRKIKALLEAGVRVFVNLTHPTDGLEPYAGIAQERAEKMGIVVQHLAFAIPDMFVPDLDETMTGALDAIDEAVEAGQIPYIHCWGGIGRTGLTVGCYLVRHGLDPEEALREVQHRYNVMEKRISHPYSPQSEAQYEYVRNWEG